MSNELKIRTLTERFLEGETTLEEEQWLYDCYRKGMFPRTCSVFVLCSWDWTT